jgi:UDP:flavonoid glycosyltransferase YjiC (YdhE family)
MARFLQVPQVSLPVLFDQFYFAEQAHYVGVGAPVLSFESLSPSTIDHALRFALSDSVRH